MIIFRNKKSAFHTIEYVTLLILVMLGVYAMGPYVKRSWNAQMKSWEDSVKDSQRDPLLSTNELVDLGECVCTWTAAQCGAQDCDARQMGYDKICNPPGCKEDTTDCEWDDSCCQNPEFFFDTSNCGLEPCGAGEIRSEPYYCGNSEEPHYDCDQWQGCDFECKGSIPNTEAYLSPCPNQTPTDNTTYYSYVNVGQCSNSPCQVQCNTDDGYEAVDYNDDGIGDKCEKNEQCWENMPVITDTIEQSEYVSDSADWCGVTIEWPEDCPSGYTASDTYTKEGEKCTYCAWWAVKDVCGTREKRPTIFRTCYKTEYKDYCVGNQCLMNNGQNVGIIDESGECVKDPTRRCYGQIQAQCTKLEPYQCLQHDECDLSCDEYDQFECIRGTCATTSNSLMQCENFSYESCRTDLGCQKDPGSGTPPDNN